MTARPDGNEAPVFRLAVLASGSGSNLQAIIDQLHHPRFALVDTGEDGAAGDKAWGGGMSLGDPAVAAAAHPTAPISGQIAAWAADTQAGTEIATKIQTEPGVEAPNAPGKVTPRIEVVLVISDVPGVYALVRAERAGIRTAVISIRDFRDRDQHDVALVTRLCEAEPDLIVLAGYMRIVSPALLKAFPWRVINLHPALLPAFPGTHSIADAVHYGAKVTGVTVHFVDPGVDTGPVIAQEPVRVEDGDTPDTLAARIHEVEHRLLPATIRLIAAGRVKPPLPGSRVVQVD
jgi:phosphoribosylglycinamide formyltransferase-1